MIKILIGMESSSDAITINNFLQENNYLSYIVSDQKNLFAKIQSGEFKILIIDVEFAEKSELNMVKFIKDRNPEVQVILVSPKDRLETSIEAARNDAFMHLTKPVSLKELKFIIGRATEATENLSVLNTAADDYFERTFIGKSDKIKKIIALVKKVAHGDSSIMITGETGTGKELIARGIHETSLRAREPFIAINCAAIPENLLESELFGYRKGAYSGAVTDKKGLVELADKGTLFLDEIGDLTLALQAKLLRVLEDKKVQRLGDEKNTKVDIRIVVATNQDLVKMTKEKTFREDLFFRINVIHIHLPALRERREDLPLLLRFYIEKYNKTHNKNIVGIEAKARTVLANYDYPGNVRELANIIEHAVVMATEDTLTFDDLPFALQHFTITPQLESHAVGAHNSKESENSDADLVLAKVEKLTIIKAFTRFGKNHTRVAKALGVSRSTLWRKMKEYEIE